MNQEIASYIKLGFASCLPVFASAVLYTLDKKTPFGKLPYWLKQIIYGLIFGFLAIIGTEWGIPLNGAMVNCRDAAVISAGLMFGAPAGIIAGVIGGVERWIAVAWGVGSFTRLACSLSTIIAGLYAAALRKFMFEDRKPGTLISFAIGIVMEVFHLTMVFITNMATPNEAMAVVKACTIPMLVSNGVSVMLSAFVVTVIGRANMGSKSEENGVRISQTVQRWLLITVLFAFITTSFFVFRLQNELAVTQADGLLDLALQDVSAEVEEASDHNLMQLAHETANHVQGENLNEVAQKYGIAEISLINQQGIITESTNPTFVGFDMGSGEQSSEFLCLLGQTLEYVQDYGPITYDPSISRKYAGVKTSDGFIQVGYDADQFQKDIAAQVLDVTKNRHVGKTGYILVLDENDSLVSSPGNITKGMIEGEFSVKEKPAEDVTFERSIGGSLCYCRGRMTEGYYVISVMPQAEVFQLRNIALYVNAFMEILVFAILFALIYLLIKKVVVNQIKKINASLGEITGGNLDVVVDVRTNAEFASLSDDINSTVDTLKRYIDEAAARIDKELTVAKNIQSSALPNVFPAFPKHKEFDIYATMDPAKEVGGDFYDFYITHDDTLHFLIADVSGKGIPAAMFMMRAKTELKTLTEADLTLNEVFTHGNNALCEGNDAGMFVTAWQGSINLETGLLQYVNAGHNPPLIRHQNGAFEYLKSRAGLVLAGMDGVSYRLNELQLEPGDCVFLYTDGVTEATSAEIQLYGEDRLLRAVNAREFEDMSDLCRYVKADVDAFVGDAPQFDDITMVAFRYIGKPPVPTVHFDAATLDDITAVTSFVEGELEKMDCPMKSVISINVAIDELFSNIVRYGYPEQPGPVTVRVIEDEDPHSVAIQFIDEGIPYNPLTKDDPDVTLSAEDRSIGGLGIFMVKKSMDDIQYRYENEQNILTIVKNLE